MCALEARVVVELGVGWQTEFPPVFHELQQSGVGCYRLLWPTSYQTAMERHRVEHFHFGATANDESDHSIKLVELDELSCYIGQVPPLRRCRASDTLFAVQSA